MPRSLSRATIVFALSFVLAACSTPAPIPPTLSEVAADTPTLTSFVALADAVDVDLDAATASGLFTVFAPSNALLDKYAAAWGFADAADLLAALGTLTADQTKAVIYFVQSHIVSDFPGLLTEDFLTDGISGREWYWYTYVEFAPGERLYTHVNNEYDFAGGVDYVETYFYGESAAGDIAAVVTELVYVAADVAFDHGIVHVLDGTLGFTDFF